jgi:hypothetical protein
LVGAAVPLVGASVARIGCPVALIRGPVALIRDLLPRVQDSISLVRGISGIDVVAFGGGQRPHRARGRSLRCGGVSPPSRTRPFAGGMVTLIGTGHALQRFLGTTQGGVRTLRASLRHLNRQ